MDDQCIVCFEVLASEATEPPPTAVPPIDSSAGADSARAASHDVKEHDNKSTPANNTRIELIAHLLPCGHNFHNDCVLAWTEKANSCPICRARFNMVELMERLGGPVVSSYAVQDKEQVPEVDPFMVYEDDEEIEQTVDECIVCGGYGDESRLLICDGCEQCCHIFCAGLDGVPHGQWFCHECIENPQILANAARSRRAQRPRTRAEQRRAGRTSSGVAWARVWQGIHNRTGIDLDFPFDEEDQQVSSATRRERRSEHRTWEQTIQIAERSGANRFRDQIAAIRNTETRHPRAATPPAPQPESQDELRAWNAFEKAKEADSGTATANSRKRKSPTTSPQEPQPENPEPERKRKRPNTTRVNRVTARAPNSTTAAAAPGPSRLPHISNRPSPSSSRRSPSHGRRGSPDGATSGTSGDEGPSFLKSLFKEMEDHNKSNGTQGLPIYSSLQTYIASSPRPSSPDGSPTGSSRAISRGGTPPPLALNSPATPPLTSNVSPIYPHSSYSPYSPVDDSGSEGERRRNGRKVAHHSPATTPPRSKDSSPNRSNTMSIVHQNKEEIQKLVRAALNPRYHSNEINKEEFTNINAEISRVLYDRLADPSDLKDRKARERWERVAHEEVSKKIRSLKAKSTTPVAQLPLRAHHPAEVPTEAN